MLETRECEMQQVGQKNVKKQGVISSLDRINCETQHLCKTIVNVLRIYTEKKFESLFQRVEW